MTEKEARAGGGGAGGWHRGASGLEESNMMPNLEGEQVGKDVQGESASARGRGLEECVCIKYTKSTGVCRRGQERSKEGPSSDPQGR